jgi:pimeloyl-ACP methyl ester carboxylesterase
MTHVRSLGLTAPSCVVAMLVAACAANSSHAPNGVVALAPDCAALSTFQFPATTIQRAVRVEQGTEGTTTVRMPAHCLVSGEIAPRTGSDGMRYSIGFELRIPLTWNGRFQFQGGGGVDGTIPPAFGMLRDGVVPALSQGTAVVTSNMGHTGTSTRDASFGLDPQARIDWGYHAMDKVTVLAKALVTRFHGKAPAHSYYVGCSGGGRQGMMMSQRFPQHFDGVVSGAPILEQHLAQIGSMQQLQAFRAIAPTDPSGAKILSRAFSDDDLRLIADGVLEKCDALDGAADGLIENHAACTYDVSALQCTGTRQPGCLSAEQVGAFTRVMQGPKNSAGTLLYPPPPWDTGIAAWRTTQLGTSTTAVPNATKATNQSIRYVFMTPPAPDFDYFAFDFDRDPARLLASAAFTTSNSIHYEGFKARGGKTIIYNGQSDSLVNPAGVNRWYRNLVAANGGLEATQAFARFFVVPGMEHCSGGQALDRFDPVTALYDWVEKGIAPTALMASGKHFPGRTRPICAYPLIARYNGSGSVNDAANFRCAAP